MTIDIQSGRAKRLALHAKEREQILKSIPNSVLKRKEKNEDPDFECEVRISEPMAEDHESLDMDSDLVFAGWKFAPNEKGRYECDHCDKTFQTKMGLKNHYSVHTGLR